MRLAPHLARRPTGNGALHLSRCQGRQISTSGEAWKLQSRCRGCWRRCPSLAHRAGPCTTAAPQASGGCAAGTSPLECRVPS